MKRWTLSLYLFAAVQAGLFAQTAGPARSFVTVSARGADVRHVIHDLFSQLDRNYVLDSTVRLQPLYLSLKDVEFEIALAEICKLAELRCRFEGGIYHVSKAPKPSAEVTIKPVIVGKPDLQPIPSREAPKGTYPNAVLGKHVTTRFTKIDLRDLMQDLARQTGLKIEVAAEVPKYRIDAFLIDTSLKYALDVVTNAAKLRYRLTDRLSIEIVPAAEAPATAKKKVS